MHFIEMKLNRFLFITGLLACMGMLMPHMASAQKTPFATKLKASIDSLQKAADKDPDTFKGNMVKMEEEWGKRKDPVEQSVAHAVLASAYREMRWTSISDFDEETRSDYTKQMNGHFAHVLDNMEALANARSSTYAPLLSKGKDSDLFGNDMLSVMLDFLVQNSGMEDWEEAAAYQRACRVYQQRGNRNAYAKMKQEWLERMRRVPRKYGALTEQQYKDSLHVLLMEVKGEEVGADVALAYMRVLNTPDDQIAFLRWALENVGHSKCKVELQSELNVLLRPSVSMDNVEGLLAGRASVTKLHFWNCERAQVTVRKYAGRERTKNGRLGALLRTGEVVDRKDVALSLDAVNAARKQKGLPVKGWASVSFNLAPGHYVLVGEGLGDSNVQEFRISTMHLMIASMNDEKFRCYVVDNETGRPLAGVKVQCRKQIPGDKEKTEGRENRNLTYEYTTGPDGMVDVDSRLWIRAVRSQDDCTEYTQLYSYRNGQLEKDQHVNIQLMTDRSIYRPGQKVMGSVLVYRQHGDEVKVVPNDSVTLRVTDSQWKEVAQLKLLTNEFGTADFELALPDGAAVGTWSFRSKSASGGETYESLRVEEYKRPTFDVTFDPRKGGKFGETIEVAGTAAMLAGAPVQAAQVHYTVQCQPNRLRWWWYGNARSWETLDEGELTTDDEGKFRVPVCLTDEFLSEEYPLIRFRVKAQVTDQNGESHEAEWSVNVSDFGYSLDVKVKEVPDLAKKPSFVIDVFDTDRVKVPMEGTYRVLYGTETVAQGAFMSGDTLQLPAALVPGVKYGIEATIVNPKNGKEVKEMAYVTPYNSALPVTSFKAMGTDKQRRPEGQPVEQDFFYTDCSEYEAGGQVDFYFSTSETDAYIIYNVYGKDGLLESQSAVTDGTMKHLRLPYRKEWGEGIHVKVMYVRNGHVAMMGQTFSLARPEKKLKLEWSTFRDKLQPGQQEQWTLIVTDKNGRRVKGAEMMAVLYDAALDRIYPHAWNFGLSFSRFIPYVRTSNESFASLPSFYLNGKVSSYRGYSRTFDQLNGFEHDRFRQRMNGPMLMSSRAAMRKGAAGALMAEVEETAAVADAADFAIADARAEEIVEEDFDNATLRENFAETAFFLPHLVSDKQGNVNIQFSLPESLTEWKFMGFVHTKDVDYGLIKATAVARKAFMLRPNMPRFLRWGDKAVIAASVVNQSEEALKGGVRMRLINPATNEVVLSMEKPFAAEAGKTVSVSFCFDVQAEWGNLDCELVAVSGHVSDGEKNPLPILSTKKEMVESVPYYIMGNADGAETAKVVDLGSLFNQNSKTAANRELKVEYTDNPAWMCIEALRGVKNPAEDDAIDYAASVYANTRLLELMKTFPLLEKYESADELQQRVMQAEQKLFALQLEDGGWSWFKGMKSSYYTTMAVCEQLAKLPRANAPIKDMLEKGMQYLDAHEWNVYNEQKAQKRVAWPPHSALRYLYLSAQMPDRAVSKDIRQMREAYLSKVEQSPKDLTIYGVANAAYALRAFGHVKSADRFVTFLKDYTVEKPGQGRFFATDAAYYSWRDYRIPTQVAAMKAIRQRDKKDAILNDMQLWLIAQKQVQKWDNPMNTIDVADFLLQVSPMETFHAAQRPVLKVDGHELQQMEYGTINTERNQQEGREANLTLQGNVLAQVPAEAVKNGVKQLEVKKHTPGISWGAAYATFLEDVGQAKSYATDELKIQRKFYVQRAGSTDWADYKAGQTLRVGDKLRIRHIITADRDMDFVRVSAQHPASLEPLRQLSGYQWLGGRGGYLSIHDASFDLYFDWFTRGTSTVDMDYSVVRAGTYEVGISTVECAYAKQFGGHTEGARMVSE